MAGCRQIGVVIELRCLATTGSQHFALTTTRLLSFRATQFSPAYASVGVFLIPHDLSSLVINTRRIPGALSCSSAGRRNGMVGAGGEGGGLYYWRVLERPAQLAVACRVVNSLLAFYPVPCSLFLMTVLFLLPASAAFCRDSHGSMNCDHENAFPESSLSVCLSPSPCSIPATIPSVSLPALSCSLAPPFSPSLTRRPPSSPFPLSLSL